MEEEKKEEETLEGDVSGEEKEADPFRVEVRVSQAGEAPEDKKADRPLQVQFLRKEGSIVDFNKFYKKMMKESMDIFVEPE